MSPPSQDTVDEGSVCSSEDKSVQSLDNMSQNGDNNSATNDGSGQDKMENIKKDISQKESQSVLKLRILVLLISTIGAIAVSVAIFMVASNVEEEEFHSQYEGAASKIVEAFDTIMIRLGAISAVATAATIEGLGNIETSPWPFVTVRSFHQRSATARLISDAEFVQVLPKVLSSDKIEWERYVVSDAKNWIEEGLEFQEHMDLNRFEHNPPTMSEVLMTNYSSKLIFYKNEKGEVLVDLGPGPYLPQWQMSPVLKKKSINENLIRLTENDIANVIIEKGDATFGGFEASEPGDHTSDNYKTAFYATIQSIRADENTYYDGEAHSNLFVPIFDNFQTNRTVVGVTKAIINWKNYLEYLLPKTVKGIDVVLRNSCGESYTYQVHGPEVEGVGFGDHHNLKFSIYKREASLHGKTIADGSKTGIPLDKKGCDYHIEVYPTQELYEGHSTSTPALITFVVAAVSLLTICIFLVYDRFVEKRQTKVLNQAAASTAIVSSLYPKQIRIRLMQQQQENDKRKGTGPKSLMKDNEQTKVGSTGTQVVADFYPYTTVIFADMAGFTAWSSTREPSQVFILLQTVFQAFDSIAKKRKVFKIETIGDCYIAVTGLPNPQAHHALIMARFAFECKQKMKEITRGLEVTLGPGTGDLCLRLSLNSGAVTAGVLQGDTRFQLFGDTVNGTARLLAFGAQDKIHISEATANLLIAVGKAHWVKLREDAAEIRGKVTKSYWLEPGSKRGSSTASSVCADSHCDTENYEGEDYETVSDVKRERMVDWMVVLLLERIRKMVATRLQVGKTASKKIYYTPPEGTTFLDEVKEIIPMSEFTCTKSDVGEVVKDIIPDDIVADLRTYVSALANTYHDNPFHNFEHACHVTMSVNKLLMRITTKEIKDDDLQSSCYTQSLCSDHLVAFAIVFSGLIHDADHRGCSNMQLIKEQPKLGELYREKSVAEQNSLDLAWKLLMEDRFSKLRSAIFANQEELLRFRQIVVNSVLATDIFDKELSDLRKARWVKAFSDDVDESEVEHLDRKATIVIEHIIQASDVSHTMQHWNVYRKWNTCLFKELYRAYKAGRMGVDPSTFWYKGELGFFDNYIIPLAGKLKDCNVFGVSSDEFLNYAVCNRAEWEERGQGVVEELVKEITQELADAEDDEKLEKAAEETEAATTAQ